MFWKNFSQNSSKGTIANDLVKSPSRPGVQTNNTPRSGFEVLIEKNLATIGTTFNVDEFADTLRIALATGRAFSFFIPTVFVSKDIAVLTGTVNDKFRQFGGSNSVGHDFMVSINT